MRILADESCDFAMVRALRESGHEVSAVCESSPSIPDHDVMSLALRENAILLTEDKDFGRSVFAESRKSLSVILLRYSQSERAQIANELCSFVGTHESDLAGAFVVLQAGRVRLNRISREIP